MRNARHTDAGAGRALAPCPPPGSRAPDATPRKDLGCFQANGSHIPRYVEISLRGQAQRPPGRAISDRFSPAQRGSRPPGGLSTSLPARLPGKRRRSHSGCAAPGDAQCRGRAWRAGSGRGSVRAPPPPPPPPQSRFLPESSQHLSETPSHSVHPDAALQGLWVPSKSGSCCRPRGGGTAPVPSPPSSLPADSRVMGNTAIAKKGSEVESGESSRRPWLGSRRMGRGAAPWAGVPQGREPRVRPCSGRS